MQLQREASESFELLFPVILQSSQERLELRNILCKSWDPALYKSVPIKSEVMPAALLRVHFTSLISHKYVPSSRCPQKKLNDLHFTSLRHLSAQWIGETTRSLRNTWPQSFVFLWRLLSKVVSSMQAASIALLNQKTKITKTKKWAHTMFNNPVYLSLANEANLLASHWKKTRSIFLISLHRRALRSTKIFS